MDKIAIVGDLHLAPKSENTSIRDHVVKGQHDFLEHLAKDLVSRGINKAVFLGDIFTNRNNLAVDAINYAMDYFKNTLKGIELYVIAGNHDMMYEDRSDITSIKILSNIPNVHLYYDKVGKETLLGRTWYFVPWILPSGMENVSNWLIKLSGKNDDQIENTVIAGHFEMVGALMEAGQISPKGFEPNKFLNAAQLTFSGHYHCRSEIKSAGHRIIYTGSPYQLSFAHVNTDCGYYIMSEDGSIEFVENNLSPRFIECIDDKLDDLPDMSNSFVRYYCKNGRPFDEALELKTKVAEKNPIHIKTIPYGGEDGTVEEQRVADDEETRRIMSLDSIGMAELYIQKFPEVLPKLYSGEDPSQKILQFLHEYDENT